MIQIREYNLQDVPQLEKLMENFQRYFISIDPERKKIDGLGYGKLKVAEMIKDVTNKHGTIFVACADSEVVGFGACIIEVLSQAQLLENPVLKYGSLTELFVDEKYRGSGLGKQLIETAEHFLKDNNCQRMYLSVIAENSKAKEFYEHNGYHVREYELAKDL